MNRRGLSPTDYIEIKKFKYRMKLNKNQENEKLKTIMKPFFHVWSIFFLGPKNDHLHFLLESCFAASHCWVNVSEQPGIALSPNAP
jgi:hypothetical protein